MFTSSPLSFEELCQLKQSEEITWLEFVQRSEYSEEYQEWLQESGLSESDDSAFLFLEKKDLDSAAVQTSVSFNIAFV